MNTSRLLRRGVPAAHGQDPAQRACILVELPDRPAQPAERGVGTFLRTECRFRLFHVRDDGFELRLDGVPALAQRRLRGIGQPVEDRRRRPSPEPQAELQPRQSILARAPDEASKQVNEPRIHSNGAPPWAARPPRCAWGPRTVSALAIVLRAGFPEGALDLPLL